MKNFRYLFLTIFSVGFLFLSCNRIDKMEQKPEKLYLVLDETDFRIGSDGGEIGTEFLANGEVRLQSLSKADWVQAEISADGQDTGESSFKTQFLRFIVSKNEAEKERSAKFMLSSGDCDDVIVTLTQEKYVYVWKDPTRELLGFEIKAQSGLKSAIEFDFDKTGKTLTAMHLKWIDKENPEMLVPAFTYKGAKVLVGDTEVESGKTAISFADDFDLIVEAESGDRTAYHVSLNCPQINRELPCLHIRPDSRIYSKETYVPTNIEFYDKTPTSTGTGWWDSDVQGKIDMRGRGNSTWDLPKKPFRMKFPEKVQPIGFDHCSEKSWALVANDMDKSLIRNYIAFEYSRIMFVKHQGYHEGKALKFTPIAQPVNVYYTGYYPDGSRKDGDYIGVYQFSDQMNKGDGRIDVDKLTAADTDPQLITGGYIMETNIHPDNENHWSSRCNIQMLYKYPEEEDHNSSQYNYITDFIGKAENALYSSNFKDPENGWRKYFDEKTMADFIIIKELVGDMDGYTSTYFYKRRGVDRLFFGPVWDCDKGWGNDRRAPGWSLDHTCRQLMIYAGFGMPGCYGDDWFKQVWKDETFRAFVNGRWKAKKQELLDRTEEILNTLPEQMEKAVTANFSVWPYYYQACGDAPLPARTYAEEIERIRALTKERAALLDKEFAK